MKSFLKNLFCSVRSSRKHATSSRQPARSRLVVEQLEERMVPAVFFPPSAVAAGSQPQLIAVGQFNTQNDNFQDMAVTNENGSVTILLGDGNGGFTPGATINLGVWGAEGIVSGDFEGTGRPDLAVASYGGAVSILHGNGDGTFTLASTLNLPPGAGPTYITAGDVNSDGKLDLVISDFNHNQILVYGGNGDGTFTALAAITSTAANGLANPEQLVLADFNGDGNLDLAVANKGSGAVSVFQGDGMGNFNLAGKIVTGTGAIGLVAADFDGDGRIDLAVTNYGTDGVAGTTISVLQNTSDGSVSFTLAATLNAGSHPVNIAAGDFDGDGKIDLAVTSADDGQVYLLQNTSAGPGAIAFTSVGSVSVGNTPVGLVSADLNGDGLPDLVLTNYTGGTVSVLLNSGSGIF